MRIWAIVAALGAVLSGGVDAASYEFGTVIDNLDRRKVTKLHAQEYCKDAKGADVSWSGKVFDVKGGRTRAKILVANAARPIYRGYNIVAVTDDLDAAAKVRKGQQVRVKGQIHRCTLKDNGAIIEVGNAEVR